MILQGDESASEAIVPVNRAFALDGSRRRDAFVVVVLVALALVATTIVDAGATAGLLDAPHGAIRPAAGRSLLGAKWIDAVIAIALALAVRRWLRLDFRALGLRLIAPGPLIAWSIGGLIAIYAAVMFSAIPIAIATIIAPEALEADLAQRTETLSILLELIGGSAALLLIAVALHEEILFRAILLPALDRLIGNRVAAVAVSSSIFGALHIEQGLAAILQTTLLGVVLASIALGAKSVWPAVAAHFAFDWLQFKLIRWLLPWIEEIQALPEV